SAFIEDNNNNTSLTWDDKVELELNALKDTTNMWNNSYTELSKMNKEEAYKSPIKEIDSENILNKMLYMEQKTEQKLTWDPIAEKDQDTISLQDEVNNAEQVPHYTPTPDIIMDDIEVNTSDTDAQTQTAMECPMEEGSQANTSSSMVTNNTEMEKTELTKKDPIIQGVTSIPEYMQDNENLQDELNTLGPTSDTTVQSNGYSNPRLSETVIEPT
ncbi:30268_t:CDS:2, partial [Gigaspora margarita]